MAFMLVLLFASFVLMQLANSSYFGSDMGAKVVTFGGALALLVAMVYISIIQYHKLAKDVPKGSRSDIFPTEVSLLRRISAPVECPNCDAKIDLTNVGEDMIYACPYCGANGVVEIEIIE